TDPTYAWRLFEPCEEIATSDEGIAIAEPATRVEPAADRRRGSKNERECPRRRNRTRCSQDRLEPEAEPDGQENRDAGILGEETHSDERTDGKGGRGRDARRI